MYDCFLIAQWHLHLVKKSMHHSNLFGFCCVWDKWNDGWSFMQTNFANVSSQEMAPKKLPAKRARKNAVWEGSSVAHGRGSQREALLGAGPMDPLWWGYHLSQHALLRVSEARLTGALSKGGKMRGVATNVYLWKNRTKPVKIKILSSGVIFTFEEGISTSHICLKGQQPIFQNCGNCVILSFFSFNFWGRQKRGSCSYVPSIEEEIRPT